MVNAYVNNPNPFGPSPSFGFCWVDHPIQVVFFQMLKIRKPTFGGGNQPLVGKPTFGGVIFANQKISTFGDSLVGG